MSFAGGRHFIFLLVFYSNLGLPLARLYSEKDFIILLENDTVGNVVYDSPTAWIVEFYSSWCGHCHAFAPTYKRLAEMTQGGCLHYKAKPSVGLSPLFLFQDRERHCPIVFRAGFIYSFMYLIFYLFAHCFSARKLKKSPQSVQVFSPFGKRAPTPNYPGTTKIPGHKSRAIFSLLRR